MSHPDFHEPESGAPAEAIDRISTDGFVLTTVVSDNPGGAPQLQWIEIKQLVVDRKYQREIVGKGRKNVVQIATNFEWSKFAPVIVAPVEGGDYAIIDGQHRTTAAALRGIAKVPCQVVITDREGQAAAFRAVNGNVTKITRAQIHAAAVAAGDKEATAILDVCASSGVTILRSSIKRAELKRGQTYAISAIDACLKLYGRDTLVTALQCITETGDGNVGLIRGDLIRALCVVLHTEPLWRDAGSSLLDAFDDYDFADLVDRAVEQPGPTVMPKVAFMAAELKAYLNRALDALTGSEKAA